MTVANRLTVARIFMAGLFFACLMFDDLLSRSLATLLFIGAGVTDWLDGWIARRTGTQSAFGALADPLADKILVMAALTAFLTIRELGIPAWTIFLTLARELIIGTLRALAGVRGTLLSADRWGKWKMGVQTGCILAILLLLLLRTAAFDYPSLLGQGRERDFVLAGLFSLPRYLSYLIVVATWTSGTLYLRKNWKLMQESWS